MKDSNHSFPLFLWRQTCSSSQSSKSEESSLEGNSISLASTCSSKDQTTSNLVNTIFFLQFLYNFETGTQGNSFSVQQASSLQVTATCSVPSQSDVKVQCCMEILARFIAVVEGSVTLSKEVLPSVAQNHSIQSIPQGNLLLLRTVSKCNIKEMKREADAFWERSLLKVLQISTVIALLT